MNLTTLSHVNSQLVETWELFDELFEEIDKNDKWDSKHGDDWTLADLPFHDREITINSILKEGDLADGKTWEAATLRELNSWNDMQFVKHSPDQPVVRSLEEWGNSKKVIQGLIAKMAEVDINEPIWFPLLFRRGWRTRLTSLIFSRDHNWYEFIQLRNIMAKNAPTPSVELSHDVIDSYMQYNYALLDKEKAVEEDFKIVWQIDGPGGGRWSVVCENGVCQVSENTISQPDITVTLDSDSFVMLTKGMILPHLALKSEYVIITGSDNLDKFSRLFPPIKIDQVIEPVAYY
jgi:hypothetical protein